MKLDFSLLPTKSNAANATAPATPLPQAPTPKLDLSLLPSKKRDTPRQPGLNLDNLSAIAKRLNPLAEADRFYDKTIADPAQGPDAGKRMAIAGAKGVGESALKFMDIFGAPFTAGTNAAVAATEDLNPAHIAKAAIKGLPLTKVVQQGLQGKELDNIRVTAPAEFKSPSAGIENVANHFLNKQGKEFKFNPIASLVTDVATSILGGKVINDTVSRPLQKAAIANERKAALEALRRNSNRQARVAERQGERVANLKAAEGERLANLKATQVKDAPKQLTAPQGFELVDEADSASRLLAQRIQKNTAKLNNTKSLPAPKPVKALPPGQNFKLVDDADSKAMDALNAFRKNFELPKVTKGVREINAGTKPATLKKDGELGQLLNRAIDRLRSQKGSAGNLGKSFDDMPEDQLRKIIETAKKDSARLSGNKKARKFLNTIGKRTPQIKEVLADAPDQVYDVLTNKQTIAKAQEYIIKKGGAERAATHLMTDSGKMTPEKLTAANMILESMAKNSDRTEDMVGLIRGLSSKLAKKGTESGQLIQAYSLYGKLTKPGALRFAQKMIDDAIDANPKLKDKLRITDDNITDINKYVDAIAAAKTPRQRTVATAQLLQTIKSTVPSTIGEKLATIQTMAQLLNPKTAIRNILGNTAFAQLENVSVTGAAVVDKALSLLTKQRTVVKPSLKAQAKGFVKGAKLGLEDAKLGIDTSGLNTRLDLPKTGVFKSKTGKTFERWLNTELRVPDRAAYTATYRESLLNQIRASRHGINKGKGIVRPTEQMKEVAHAEALQRTFQDTNALSKAFKTLKEGFNYLGLKSVGKGDFGLGDLVLKYPKTPANLIARGLAYSPVGFTKALYYANKGLAKDPNNQRQFALAFSRAMTGTGLIAAGSMLADLGVITGRNDRSRNLVKMDEEIGIRDYQLNRHALARVVMAMSAGGDVKEAAEWKKGDNLLTYDWFQPTAIQLAMGANIANTKGSDNSGTMLLANIVDTVAAATQAGTTTVIEQPLLQGVRQLFGFGGKPESVMDGVTRSFVGMPASFVPSLVNQVRLFVDDVAPDKREDTASKQIASLIKGRTPFASKSLRPQLNPFGDKKEFKISKNLPRRLFDVFFNPSISTEYGNSKNFEVAKEMSRLGVGVPRTGSEIKNLPATRQNRFNVDQARGRDMTPKLNTLIKSAAYQALSDEQKEKRIRKIVRRAGESARRAEALKIKQKGE